MSATAVGAPRARQRRVLLPGLVWVTWRQHRIALAGAVLLLAGVSAWLVVSGRSMHHAFASYGLTSCGNLSGPVGPGCRTSLELFRQQYQSLVDSVTQPLLIIPVALGIFLGAPVVAREIESGTYRFAWTQGRNRVRWMVVKLAILGAILTLLALAFSGLFTWWYGPWAAIRGRMSPGSAYEVSGIVFAARTLFAFSLGAFLGAVIRRTVPAMVATAVVFVVMAIASTAWLRPMIEQPVTVLVGGSALETAAFGIQLNNGNRALVGAEGPQTSWQLSMWTQDSTGHHLTTSQTYTMLQDAQAGPFSPDAPRAGQGPTQAPAGSVDPLPQWLIQHDYKLGTTYQPNGRFWHFQSVEAGTYLLVSLLCAVATVRWIRRRVT